MSTNFEKISSNKVKLTFVVPAEDFDKALNQAYLKDRSKINVPGFRKGKAPRAVIERMYGEGVFYDDALDAISRRCMPRPSRNTTSTLWIVRRWMCRKSARAKN